MHTCKKFSGLGRTFREIASALKFYGAGEFPERRQNQFPNYISPCAGRPDGRLQKPIRIPIIIRRWIGETPWLYYASPHQPTWCRPLSKYGDRDPYRGGDSVTVLIVVECQLHCCWAQRARWAVDPITAANWPWEADSGQLPFLPEYVLTSEQSRVKWKRLLCEIGELFATLDCLSPPICSFCPVPLLNDCDQATLIILTGFLQFDEYVDGCAVLCAESDFKIGPLWRTRELQSLRIRNNVLRLRPPLSTWLLTPCCW